MSGNSDVLRIKRAKSFGGEISVPGDKSISPSSDAGCNL